MSRLTTILLILLSFSYPIITSANKLSIEEFTLKDTTLNEVKKVNAVFPSTWTSKILNKTLTFYNPSQNPRITIELNNSVDKEFNVYCYDNLKISKLDSKLYLLDQINKGELIFQGDLLNNYKLGENEKVKVFSITNEQLFEKLSSTNQNYNFCIKSTKSLNQNYKINYIYSNDDELETIRSIFKSLKITDYITPDQENQRSPIAAINETILETPKTNFFIILGLLIFLGLFTIFLVYATRIKRDV
jgi:hypothetical protein